MLIVTMMTPTQAIFGMTDQAPVAQQVAQPVEQSVEQQLVDLASLSPAELDDLLDLSKLFDCINLFQILNPEVSPAPAPEREATNHLVTEEELVTDEEVLTDPRDISTSEEHYSSTRGKRAVTPETIFDAASLGHSIYEYNKQPSLKNALFAVWDAAAVVIPVVPGSYVAKILTKTPIDAPKDFNKLKNGQGYKDSNGDVWKKDMLHKDHFDISNSKGEKIKEVDFQGTEIWPNGPKNKNKKP